MGKRAIKILTKISKKVSADIPSLIAHRQFHIFNKTKTEVSTSKKLSRALSLNIRPLFHHVHPSRTREVCLLCELL